eukprot:CAMPEP_0181311752 /NCGR_PEP_ID=MMETSP1101-20121128/13316_1 /TAXON_ID=46948 /ORGANISM="Rhodomonas abbreviata, Strain Caron Lab Isolate" /LENGTH=576 /DNA_ID=CAMNT_0023418527 /DNA_START=26 /DNA_END=1756 /DNA_ORIENTATION=-
MRTIWLTIAAVCLQSARAQEQGVLSARAWQTNAQFPSIEDFPEAKLFEDNGKPNTAIAFSGGGSRAFTTAMGYLAALHELDLFENIRYIGGISGGGWAVTSFSFVQNVSDDTVLLGKIVQPEDIRLADLKTMDERCIRGLVSKELTLIAAEAYFTAAGGVHSVAEAWSYGVSNVYLEPLGIPPNTRFSWNQETVDDIKKRNPSLADETFTIPVNPHRPFPIIGTALVGPTQGAPYVEGTQNFSIFEITPLYVGSMKNLEVDFQYHSDHGRVHTKSIGGVMEPFAFARAGGGAPTFGLGEKRSSGLLGVPAPGTFLDLQFAAGSVSYAPGALFESIRIPALAEDLSMQFDYFSPAVALPQSEAMMFTDGGCYENIPLISFIQRRVPKIVLFFMSAVPLLPADQWDVTTEPYSEDKISNDLSSFFGVVDNSIARWENRSYDIGKNQVFATEDYAVVVQGLQAAQQEGSGIIATFNLTTVENLWWGVPAGLAFEITFSYLGRLSTWESLLTPEMHGLAVPNDPQTASDLSQDVQHGPFKNFPHYATKGGGINAEQANLLADLSGWSVLQHEELFRRVLS